MPYLTEGDFNAPSGELNRAITKLFISCNNSLEFEGKLVAVIKKYEHDQKPRYATFNDIIGALECALMEFKRRGLGLGHRVQEIEEVVKSVKSQYYGSTIAPYEDKKIQEHGDIYGTV